MNIEYNSSTSMYSSQSSGSLSSSKSGSPSYPPTQIEENRLQKNSDYQYNTALTMMDKGYIQTNKIAETLQGSIWNGTFGSTNSVVIKMTSKSLHSSGITILNGKKVEIEENILKEMNILKYLTNNITISALSNMVSYVDFFEDERNYFLIMENGGTSLFEFVLKAHKLIILNKLSVYEWTKTVKIIFKQMVSFIHTLHNEMSVAHLDISLENILINDILIKMNPNTNQIEFVSDCNIKFCDFGLAQIFDQKTNPSFKSNKFVGKVGYKSPEIYERKSNFSGKAADVWSLGVCLFALLVGSMPFNKPSKSDPVYQWVIHGKIYDLLKQWNKLHYIDHLSLDILLKIFRTEPSRISTENLLKHKWLS